MVPLKSKKLAASFVAWGVKDTTNIPYIITHADFCDAYNHPVVSIFHTREDVREWIRENRCGYTWTPVKVLIQEISVPIGGKR